MSNNSYNKDVSHNYLKNDDKSQELKENLSSSTNTTTIFGSTKITFKNYIKSKKINFGDKTLTHQWWDNDDNLNFKIDDAKYSEFLKIYSREISNFDTNADIDNENILHVMEQPKEIGPLCLDFDFKQNLPERIVCVDNIIHIIGIINNMVVKYFKINEKKILESYVLMKTEPFFNKKKLNYSDGFHLQYPNLILSSANRYLIYQESKKEIIRQDIFSNVYSILSKVNSYAKQTDSDTLSCDDSDYDLKSSNEVNNYYFLDDKEKEKINDEIFDNSVILKNKWFMYGSGKNIEGEINVYKLKYIFNYNVDEIEDIPSNKELVKILSIRKPSNEENEIHSKNNEEYNKIIEQVKLKYLKKNDKIFDINKLFIKSTNPNVELYADVDVNDNFNIYNKEIKKPNSDNKTINFSKNTFNKNSSEKENILYAKELVKLLSKNRAIPYEDWISVGWCLYNISPTLLNDFLEFSSLAGKKFDRNSCIKVWEDCSRRNDSTGYSIPSLIKWAKEDNLNEYKLLLKKRLNKMIEGRDLKTDFDVAHIVYEYYKYDYVCSGVEKRIWWEFNGNNWNRMDGAYSLSIRLSSELPLELAQLNNDVLKYAATEQGQIADVYQKKLRNITDLIFNLKKSAFKDKILKEAAGLYMQKDFESKLDQNIYLVGFTNGVYDLKTKIFRKGEPHDLIRKTVGYDYKEFDLDNPVIKEIENFLESIQPEKDMRDYLCAYLASFLEGSNKDQKFMIWTGCHAIDQKIIMNDKTTKKVQDIIVGDELMGDDMKPRKVLNLIRGNGQMYKIKTLEEEFIVNEEHILTLVYNNPITNIYFLDEGYYYNTHELINGKLIENKIYKKFDTKTDYKIILKEFEKEIINLEKTNNNILKSNNIVDICLKTLLEFTNNKYLNNNIIDLSHLFCSRKVLFDNEQTHILNDIENNILFTYKDVYGLKIEKMEIDNYYGFQIDKNNRYLMDNFIITHNCGQNGKGSLIDLIDNTFNGTSDGYFSTLPPTILTQKRGSSSAATPELADKFGKRIIVLQEPEGDDKINTGFMKNITGQDKIEARPLYGEPFQYTPLFKLLLACNHLPNILSDDGGTWRRIRVIDFIIKFCSNPLNPNERKSDTKLREKIKKWKEGFMWLLINVYYPMYVVNDGLDKLEPERVKLSTDKYKSDSNVIMEFFDEILEKDDNSEIVFNDIYDGFRSWYINSYNDKKPLQRKKFREYFENNNYKLINNNKGIVIKGIKMKEHLISELIDIDNDYIGNE